MKNLLLFCVLFIATQSFAQIQVYDYPGAKNTWITGMNDSGDFVGYFQDTADKIKGFYWSKGKEYEVMYPSSVQTRCAGINNKMQIAGTFNTTGSTANNKGFIYYANDSTLNFKNIISLDGRSSLVVSNLNDDTEVVGDYLEGGRRKSFVSQNYLGNLETFQVDNQNTLNTYCTDINNWSRLTCYIIDGIEYRNYLRDAIKDYKQTISSPNQRPRVYGINDADEMVGNFQNAGAFYVYRHNNVAFRHAPLTLPGIDYASIWPQDINNKSQVGGYFVDKNGLTHGFIILGYDNKFRPNPDGWRFANDSNIWPATWYNQFNYVIDPYLGIDSVPQHLNYVNNASLPIGIPSAVFPDWPLYVENYTQAACYVKDSANVDRLRLFAIEKWFNLTDFWNGSCYGFSNSALLGFHNMTELRKKFSGTGTGAKVYNIQLDDSTRKTVNGAMVHQFGKKQTEFRVDGYRKYTGLQVIAELKELFMSNDNQKQRALGFLNQKSSGGHNVVPFKLESGESEYKLFVYDNNYPNDSTRHFTVNKNSGIWKYNGAVNSSAPPDEWGGISNKMIRIDAPIAYLMDVPEINEQFYDDYMTEPNATGSLMDISMTRFSDYTIKASTDSAGYINSSFFYPQFDKLIVEFPLSSALNSKPQYTSDAPEVIVNVRNGRKQYGYEANLLRMFSGEHMLGVDLPDTGANMMFDVRLRYDEMDFTNTSSMDLKPILINTMSVDSFESSWRISWGKLASKQTISIKDNQNGAILIGNSGGASTYVTKLRYISSLSSGEILIPAVSIDSNSSHTIIPDFSAIATGTIRILVDNGQNNTTDDTLKFSNESAPRAVYSWRKRTLQGGMGSDSLTISNSGGGLLNWQIISAPSWINSTTPTSGVQGAKITFNYGVNSGNIREGFIIIRHASGTDTLKLTQASALNPPTGLAASQGTRGGEVLVSWNAINPGNRYKVWRSEIANLDGAAVTGWIADTFWADKNVTIGKTYYYKVQASSDAQGTIQSLLSKQVNGYPACAFADFMVIRKCLGDTTIFLNQSAHGSNTRYRWELNPGNQTFDFNNTWFRTFADTGSYTLKLYIEDTARGCASEYEQKFSITPKPQFSLGNDFTLAADGKQTLNGPAGMSTYRWYNNAATQNIEVDAAALGEGEHWVWLRVTDGNGCQYTDSVKVTVEAASSVAEIAGVQIRLYPNPARESIYLNFENAGYQDVYRVSLINTSGALVNRPIEWKGSGVMRIETSGIAAGFYLVQVESAAGKAIFKVMIAK